MTAVRALTVGEIIARHQQQQRAQDALLQHYVAHARMEQHFRPTVADPGYDVVTENAISRQRTASSGKSSRFSVNGAMWGADRPPFPLLQPEKVLSLPLQLRFDEGYRYRLAGTERVDGFDCYVVQLRAGAAATAPCIAARSGSTSGRSRASACRRHRAGCRAPVVSNEENQHFSAVLTVGNRPVFLFSALTARQIMLLAGRNLLVEKRVEFSDFRVNEPEFERERDSARESRRVSCSARPPPVCATTSRKTAVASSAIARRATCRAMAMGVTLDPSLRVSAADFRHQLPRLPVRQSRYTARDPVCRRAGRRQHPAVAPRPKTVDASVDFFAIARAVERSGL